MSEQPLICSQCGGEVPLDENGRTPPLCPHCGQMVVVDDETEQDQPAIAPEDELEEAKILRVVRERRAQVRTRGYYLVLMLACWVMAGQLAWVAVSALRLKGFHVLALGHFAAAAALLLLGWAMRRRAAAMAQKIRGSALPEPQKPPDFTGLSDGSQHAKNLEDTQ